MQESFKIPSATFPTLAGDIVTFNSQYAGLPLKSHKIALTATQSGSGTPSPDNVRTINGYSAINVYHPDNLIDFSQCEKGYLSLTGVMTNPTGNMEWTSEKIAVTPNSSIVWWADIVATDSQWVAFSYYDSSDNFIRRDSWSYTTQIYTRTVTVPNNATSVRMSWRNFSNDDFTNRYLFTASQGLNTITIGSTVYGGEYDARTGVLRASVKGILARDVSGWAKSGSVFYRNFADVWTAITPDTPTGRKPLLCSHFDYSSSSIVADLKVGYGGANNNGNIVIRYDALSTISDFNDYIANNDVFIVYPLATPRTIQLPPCPIDTLEVVNNIWADTGDTTLQYPKFG